MFSNTALDVVIGLVFIYLLYSLLGTIIEELIATNIGLRGLVLEMAIKRMLDDDNCETDGGKGVKTVAVGNAGKVDASGKARARPKAKKGKLGGNKDKLSEAFYAHPLIKFLHADALFIKKKPAYINKETFSKVVIDLLRGADAQPGDSFRPMIQGSLTTGETAWKTVSGAGAPIEKETLQYLKSIWADSQGDVDKFKGYIEQWFNEMMDRTTGWYKKYTQIILLVVGFIMAIIFNVDTVKITTKLQNDPKLREQVIAQASDFTKAHPNLDQQLAQQKKTVDSLLNAKKSDTSSSRNDSNAVRDKLIADTANSNTAKALALRDSLYSQANELVKGDISKVNNLLGLGWGDNKSNFDRYSILGWLITALAISLGAPFWFDLLNKLMKLRGSVAPKEEKAGKGGNAAGAGTKTGRVG